MYITLVDTLNTQYAHCYKESVKINGLWIVIREVSDFILIYIGYDYDTYLFAIDETKIQFWIYSKIFFRNSIRYSKTSKENRLVYLSS